MNDLTDGVRFAKTEQEFEASYQLRYKVYVESMGRLKDKSDHQKKELKDKYDKTAHVAIAIKQGKPVGTLRLFWGKDTPFDQNLKNAYHLHPLLERLQADKICIVERLMVEEQSRRSNITLRLYKEVMHFVLEKKAEVVLLDCEPHHLNSYLKLGFRPYAKTYSYPGIGLVVPMALIVGDYNHLQRVGSPFAMLTTEEDLNYCQHVDKLNTLISPRSKIISRSDFDSKDFLEQVYNDAKPQKNQELSIFDSLSESEIERVIDKSHIIECSKGDRIIEKNNTARTIFIVLSGFVEVRRDGHLLAVISPGEVIGEIAFFLDIKRTASVLAATDDVKLLSLDDASLSRMMKFESTIANKILKNFCRGLCHRIINGVEIADLRSN